MNRRRFLRNLGACGAALQFGAAQGGPVTCRVVDEKTGRALAARVRLMDSQGREVVPHGHADRLAEGAQEGDVRFQSRRYCYINGEFAVDRARLPLRYQILKGYEYRIAEGELTGPMTLPLSRWSSVSDRGWYSGDVHIHHIAPKTCRLEMDAEDLNVANILTSDFTKDQREFERAAASSSRSWAVRGVAIALIPCQSKGG